MADREFDVFLFAASGFVGQLARRAPSGVRVALAGRTRERVTAVRDGLGADRPVLTADSADEASIRELASSSGAVVSTFGPYDRARDRCPDRSCGFEVRPG